MVLFNYSTRELTAKIVYYGPGLCGKTTNLHFIHENLPETVKGKMLSLATKTDRTLFFDFLPIDLGEIRGMKTRVQLYTVPGQVFYNETRKLVLKGADGIVFVADSQEQMLGTNVESFKNLEENLKAHGMRLGDMPHVIQFNKRDLPKLASIEDLNTALNRFNAPFYESVATTGIGVQDTLKAIVKLVLLHLTRKYDPKSAAVAAQATPASPPPAPIAAAPLPSPSRPSVSRPAIPLAPVPPMQESRPSRPAFQPAAPQPAVAAARNSPVAEFNDAEIESLMTEVDAAAEPAIAPQRAAWPETDGDSVWMGSPDEDVIMARTSPDAIEEAYEKTLDEPLEDEAPAEAPFPETTVRFESLDFEPEREAIDRFDDPAPPLDEPPVERTASAWTAAASSAGPAFEIDRGFDPEWPPVEPDPLEIAPSAPMVDFERGIPLSPSPDLAPLSSAPEARFAPEPAAAPTRFDEDEAEEAVAGLPPDPAIVLSEVVDDGALFSDPTLEIAKLDADDVREIVVPVQVGAGTEVKRFKLSIRLRLDPVD